MVYSRQAAVKVSPFYPLEVLFVQPAIVTTPESAKMAPIALNFQHSLLSRFQFHLANAIFIISYC